jgi:pimeloyl-ACP methyl ester carboxylesterase
MTGMLEISATRPPSAPGSAVRVIGGIIDAGAVSTEYLRAGSGEPVLLLAAPDEPGDLRHQMLQALAPSFRVIVPGPPAAADEGTHPLAASGGPVAFSAWLRDFLDALGVAEAAMVVEGRLAVPVLDFALRHPGRVGRLAVIHRGAGDPVLPAPGAEGPLAGCAALLLLRAEAAGPGGRAVEPTLESDLIPFLRRAPEPAPAETLDVAGGLRAY